MRFCSLRVFPQNTAQMSKHSCPAPPGPSPPEAGALPEGPSAVPPPEPAAGPQKPRPSKRLRDSGACGEQKRRKGIDIENLFSSVEAVLLLPTQPLIHTPQSLFSMLCGVFELEFPNRLPKQLLEQTRHALVT